MASLGSGALAPSPAMSTIAASLTPYPGGAIGSSTVTLANLNGSGGATYPTSGVAFPKGY